MTFAIRHPRPVLLLAILAIVGLSLTPFRRTHLGPFFHIHSSQSNHDMLSSYISPNIIDAKISLPAIIDQILSSISASASSFDVVKTRQELGIDGINDLNIQEYAADLRSIHTEFFTTAKTDVLLPRVLSHLSLLPSIRSGTLPKNIYTTDLVPPSEFPDQFHSWAEMNPEWQVNFVSEDAMDEWLESRFPSGDGITREMKALRGGRGIVRADLFRYILHPSFGPADSVRYLVLLLHGGVYTDTDTACIRSIPEWAEHPDEPSVHPLLTSLPHLVRLADQSPIEEASGDGPSLLVSIEHDSSMTGDPNWREVNIARGLQVSQWTILAKQGHPILMDVIGRALRIAKAIREAEEEGREVDVPDVVSAPLNQLVVYLSPAQLEWTGPGAL